jgi:hypothetical protein
MFMVVPAGRITLPQGTNTHRAKFIIELAVSAVVVSMGIATCGNDHEHA